MDGIFGVGLGEMVMIAIVLMIIGGPRNTVKWAREAGRMLHQLRMQWSRLTADLEKELDAEGKELLQVSRQIQKGFNEAKSAVNPVKKALAETTKVLNEPVVAPQKTKSVVKKPAEKPAATPTETPAEMSNGNSSGRYDAWLSEEQE